MRVTRAVAVVLASVLSAVAPAAAQDDWAEYQNIPDGFKVDFPGQPKMTEMAWKTQFGYTAPARVYSADRGREHYSVTVVDYNAIQQQGIDRRKACPAGAEPCIGSDLSGPGYWMHDIRGALIYAAYKYMQKDVKVTNYLWAHMDLVEGAELQLTNNPDQSRTFVFIAMHQNKLYIFDGTVPKGYPAPGLFQQSVGFVDKDGNGIRYQKIYSNEVYGLGDAPTPSYGGGGGGGGRGRGAGAGQGRGGRAAGPRAQ